MNQFCYEKLSDPRYFKEGCVPAHSDHQYYRSEEEALTGRSSFEASLNGPWKFHYARNVQQTIPGFEELGFSCRGWAEIRVPGHIQLQGYDRPQYVNVQYPWEGHEALHPGEVPEAFNPVASYVKYFDVPEAMEGERLFLCLEGAESAAAVWLNGVFLGYHEDSFTPAEFELTEALCPGENKLAVQVFKWCSGSWCEDQDFFRFSGLYRDVVLRSVPAVHVQDLKITALPSEDLQTARLTVEAQMTGSARLELELYLAGERVAAGQVHGSGACIWSETVRQPKLWSSEEPVLYELLIRACDAAGRPQEYLREKVGFRRFELRDSILYLNGQRIVFKGVNRHEFSSIGGRCVTPEETEKDLRTMKQNNINAIRTSHYPNASVLYRLCDEYGIYLMDEMNLETHGTWDQVRAGQSVSEVLPKDRDEWRAALLDRAQNMLQRDKNHPSVLIWSCGNESYGGSVIRAVSQYLREADGTRPVHYEGVFQDRSCPDTSDIESQMYPSAQAVREYLQVHRDKPFLCCEYCHAMGNSCGGLDRYVQLTREEPLYQGGFIWDYIDQSLSCTDRYGKPFEAYGGDFDDRPNDGNFSGNGLVYGPGRVPSPKMQEVKFLYSSILVEPSQTQVTIKNENLFANTALYECRVRLEREGELLRQTTLEACVPPQSSACLPLPFAPCTVPGEYCITVSFHLRENTRWASRGHEVAFGQTVYRVGRAVRPQQAPVRLVQSPHVIGVQGASFEVLFARSTGSLLSYRYAGQELLKAGPRPHFWRAPTDNDNGCLMPARYGQWKLASLYGGPLQVDEAGGYPTAEAPAVEAGPEQVKLRFTWHLPTRPAAQCTVCYTVDGSGQVAASLAYDPVEGLGDPPEFGWLFTLDARYDRLRWYGCGPEETYVDRCCGGKLGLYTNRVQDNLARYLVPQECGSKEGVRWASLTDPAGRGLLFCAAGEPMSFSALPYTPEQLEAAAHPNELPPIHSTIVRASLARMGVGGDDSWGARPHPEALLPAHAPLRFTVTFRGI